MTCRSVVSLRTVSSHTDVVKVEGNVVMVDSHSTSAPLQTDCLHVRFIRKTSDAELCNSAYRKNSSSLGLGKSLFNATY